MQFPLDGFKKIQFELWFKAPILILTTPKFSIERQNSLINIFLNLSEIQGRSKDKKKLAKYFKT